LLHRGGRRRGLLRHAGGARGAGARGQPGGPVRGLAMSTRLSPGQAEHRDRHDGDRRLRGAQRGVRPRRT
ncbi:hypothetical protein DF186_16610, partial [Enterococcus hirae]